MNRPRSVVGLLLRLAMLHARRRPARCAAVLACVLAVLAAIAWPRHRMDRRAAPGDLQVGVLHDGFVLTHATETGRRVVELDAQGRMRREVALRHAGDLRVVGVSVGIAMAWQDGKRVRLANVDDERDVSTWGNAVRHLCDGVASNDERFAVGWLEGDDTVWMVHGPVAATRVADAPSTAERVERARTSWCGVASAEQNVALLWREADRLRFTMCTKKRCSTFPARFELPSRIPILGFGCLRDACLIAARDEANHTRLALLMETSKSKWTTPLETAASAVSIVGVGDRAFAVGYATGAGSEVVRVDRDGGATSLWRDPASTSTPALAWSSGRLLIAHRRGEALVHDTIALPR